MIRRANVRQISSGCKRLVKALVVAHLFSCHLGWHSKALWSQQNHVNMETLKDQEASPKICVGVLKCACSCFVLCMV